MTKRRDDFSRQVKELLAKRVAFRCSKCGNETLGPKANADGFVCIGVASHITAAAPNGPRFDSTLTSEERAHQTNGIWLCPGCSRIVDGDPDSYSVDSLRQIKRNAEQQTLASVAAGGRRSPDVRGVIELDEDDLKTLASLGLSAEDNLESILPRLAEAANSDIEGFKGRAPWPTHAIQLNLRAKIGGNAMALTIPSIANLLPITQRLSLISAPGTGKSTSMVQFASELNASGKEIAILAPLPEWSAQSEPLLGWLTSRLAFQSFRKQHLMLLALHGCLTLLLDGWNELDADGRIRLNLQLDPVKREFPLLKLVFSSRRQAIGVPDGGPEIHLEPLSYRQQLELAQALRGAEGASILDHARRTPGIRELMSVPLCLTSLMSYASGDRMPQTKEEVLRLFVEKQEAGHSKAETLDSELLGFHRAMLIALAIKATSLSKTFLDEKTARVAIAEFQKELVETGQLSTPLQPQVILSILVSHGLLVRGGPDFLSFQHQQFQEWHASIEVERLVRGSFANKKEDRCRLIEALNYPAWEEAVLFACERLSHSTNAAPDAVANAILRTLAIDPIFAGEMIYRSSEAVWELVKGETEAFVERWHKPGTVDRAISFVITTGRKEFSNLVWNLLNNPDSQVHLAVVGATVQFRPTVLGFDFESRIAAMQEDRRASLLSGIVTRGGIDGIELGSSIAKSDLSETVREAVLRALLFRNAQHQAAELLRTESPLLWRTFLEMAHPSEVWDQELALKLRVEEQRLIAEENDAFRKIFRLLELDELSSAQAAQLSQLISEGNFNGKGGELDHALSRSRRRFPELTQAALIARLRAGRKTDFGERILEESPVMEDDKIAAFVSDPRAHQNQSLIAMSILGPTSLGPLIKTTITWGVGFHSGSGAAKGERHPFEILRDRVEASRNNSFLRAIADYPTPPTVVEICILAELVRRHGKELNLGSLEGDPELIAAVALAISKWVNLIFTLPGTKRCQLADIAMAITRIGHPSLLPNLERLEAQDDRLQKISHQAVLAGTASQDVRSDAMTTWLPHYKRAFAAISGQAVVELMLSRLKSKEKRLAAAFVLRWIYGKRSTEGPSDADDNWNAYSEIRRRRILKRSVDKEVGSSFSKAILDQVRNVDLNSLNDGELDECFQLAAVAWSMPFKGEADFISKLSSHPKRNRQKYFLQLTLVLSGEVISDYVPAAAVNELIEASKTQPWKLESQDRELQNWLELFSFTDRPKSLFDVLAQFDLKLLTPDRLHGVMNSIVRSPVAERETMLRNLADHVPLLWKDEQLLSAFLACETSKGRLAALEVLSTGKLENLARRGKDWHIARELAAELQAHPEFRSPVYFRLRQALPKTARSILMRAVAEAPDTDGIMELIRCYVEDGRMFDGNLSWALDKIALEKQDDPQLRGAFREFGFDVSDLRLRLFELASDGGLQKAIAEAALNAIDEIRDHHGRADTEPRHPNIRTKQPWPRAAKWIDDTG